MARHSFVRGSPPKSVTNEPVISSPLRTPLYRLVEVTPSRSLSTRNEISPSRTLPRRISLSLVEPVSLPVSRSPSCFNRKVEVERNSPKVVVHFQGPSTSSERRADHSYVSSAPDQFETMSPLILL